jgi:quinol monooxygenase YgiN
MSTPETDDIARGNHVVPVEWAQQLERERNESQEKFATEATEHMLAVNKLSNERDEVREAWYQMQSSFERSRDEVEKLIRERDEAREAFKEMWRSGDAFLPHVDSETINRWRKAAGWEETK